MSRLAELIGEHRARQGNPDRTRVIFCIFFDPVTRAECTDLLRTAKVIGGPELQQEPEESVEAFEARVNAAVEKTNTRGDC
jgi:hypothetical protein